MTLITHRIGSAQRRLCTVVLCLSLMLAWSAVHRPAAAQSDDYAAAIAALNADSFRAKQAAIEALVALRQPAAVPVLEAMLNRGGSRLSPPAIERAVKLGVELYYAAS